MDRLPRSKTKRTDSIDLRTEYDRTSFDAQKLIEFYKDQLSTFSSNNDIPLAFPIDGRVKELESITEKCERKGVKLEKIEQFDDFVGIRVVCLFKKDIEKLHSFITETFEILSLEDTASRLSENSFGYQSNHYVANLPDKWKDIPSMQAAGKLKIEIQVRTLSQHMWAAVSHKLQYKIEDSVPYELRRSINRSSAILELIDLEFDRVLLERNNYVQEIQKASTSNKQIDIDLFQKIVEELVPESNRKKKELYDEAFEESIALGLDTTEKLREFITKNIDEAIAEDKRYFSDTGGHGLSSKELISKGSYFSTVGMIRNMFECQFGENWREEAGLENF